MDRKNMYRVPANPSSVIRKLADENIIGKPAAGRLIAAANAVASIAKNSGSNKYAVKDLTKGTGVPGKTTSNLESTKQTEIQVESIKAFKNVNYDAMKPEISQNQLQEAIIWSEILGKPVSKRGKRRMSWQ